MSVAAVPGSAAAAGGAPAAVAGSARVAVLGAGGYAGQEFVRLARGHGKIEIAALCVREPGTRTAADLLPGLDPDRPAPPLCAAGDLEARLEAGEFDTLVACLPHGAWAALSREYPGLCAGARVLDLSSDHRDDRDGYVYGLPEGFRAAIAGASRVANPGCFATAAVLALIPAAEAGLFGGPIAVTALSGASGAGRSPALRHSFVEAEGGAWIYRAGTGHAHVAEVERVLARLGGSSQPLGLTPQVVPMSRGILLTAYAPLSQPVEPDEIRARYAERYAGEPFVRILAPGDWPETRAVRHSNRCDLAVTTLHGGRTLLATAALDNLVKGAAGQAIQNLNLMCGWAETTGLSSDGSPW